MDSRSQRSVVNGKQVVLSDETTAAGVRQPLEPLEEGGQLLVENPTMDAMPKLTKEVRRDTADGNVALTEGVPLSTVAASRPRNPPTRPTAISILPSGALVVVVVAVAASILWFATRHHIAPSLPTTPASEISADTRSHAGNGQDTAREDGGTHNDCATSDTRIVLGERDLVDVSTMTPKTPTRVEVVVNNSGPPATPHSFIQSATPTLEPPKAHARCPSCGCLVQFSTSTAPAEFICPHCSACNVRNDGPRESLPIRKYALRHDGAILNIHVNGAPTIVWSDGYVDTWADNNQRHCVLSPGVRLRFPNNGTIHAVPLNQLATTLYAEAAGRRIQSSPRATPYPVRTVDIPAVNASALPSQAASR